jgi:DNA-binding beta-propeller fold protein YncE
MAPGKAPVLGTHSSRFSNLRAEVEAMLRRMSPVVSVPAGLLGLLAVLSTLGTARVAAAQPSFITFESGHVRPLAQTPDGSRLLAVNTPDNRLEVFDVLGNGDLSHAGSIPVGMEPVAVAARTNTEIWVVNHLSDSISIVDLAASPPQVVRTLLVGDEPRDIVFAGADPLRAFITTAHRGQHRTDASISSVPGAGDPQLTTEGIGRADVWVFDTTDLGATLGGTPDEILSFFADTPRALATDGTTVYVAAFHSGNQTTVINETVVPDGFGPGGVPGPDDNAADQGDPNAPETGVIVKFDGAAWRDASGHDWSADVNFDLPDHDVFSINANTLAPSPVAQFDHVGTILFNMVVHPDPLNGKVFVTNTELPNDVLFEGPGVFGGSTVQGHLSESRITVIDPSGPSVTPKHLNNHIQYGDLHTDAGADHAAINAQIPHSLATPLQPILSSDGGTLYVAAFGSAKIGVFNTSDIEDPAFDANFDPTVESANYIPTGGGPSGLVLNEGDNRLYVMTRFDNSVSVIDLGSKATLETHALHNPEPPSVVEGRPFLYDATTTSGNGEASCSSCHIFADFDSLAWNLGNPDDVTSNNTQPLSNPLLPNETTFHPMKGPMTTQTLRGLATHGGMHWRGDRVDGFFSPGGTSCSEPTGAPCSEDTSFRNFIVAFEGLVGHEGLISAVDMQKFADFALQIMLPPNPVANLDGTLTSSQQDGKDVFFECGPGTTECGFPPIAESDTVEDCDGCHNLDPISGFFGTGGEKSFEGEPQHFKVAHMRNLYAKVGMFGISTGGSHTGDQVRGFGFLHDGSVDTVFDFLSAPVFNLTNAEQLDLEQFALAFPSDLAPIVGQQVTRTASNGGAVDGRIATLIDRSVAPFDSLMLGGTVTECDLIVKGSFGGAERGWLHTSGNLPTNAQYLDDTNTLVDHATLIGLATSEGPLTFTCAPPGSGTRMGINRDGDVVLDGLDNCPAVPNDDQADTNMNGIGDVCEAALVDTDGDGEPDATDNCPGDFNPGQEDNDLDGLGDVCDDDDDNDGLLDVVETDTDVFLSPTDTGTDPLDADSDNDGIDDGTEVALGSDPNDAGSTPAVPAVPLAGLGLLAAAVATAGARALRRRA